MSSHINDGGPAFPVREAERFNPENNETHATEQHWGMSLRDYFAGQALGAIMITEVMEAFRRNDYDGKQDHNTYVPVQTMEELAQLAYGFADAMVERHGRDGAA